MENEQCKKEKKSLKISIIWKYSSSFPIMTELWKRKKNKNAQIASSELTEKDKQKLKFYRHLSTANNKEIEIPWEKVLSKMTHSNSIWYFRV
jgi:hypothetical protein